MSRKTMTIDINNIDGYLTIVQYRAFKIPMPIIEFNIYGDCQQFGDLMSPIKILNNLWKSKIFYI